MVKMLKKPIAIFKALLDLVLPPVCYVCGTSCSGKYGLCEMCLGKISYIGLPQCLKCGRRVPNKESLCGECRIKTFYLKRAWSCCYYKDTVKECIHLFKYKGYVGLADIFRDIMVGFVEKNKLQQETDLIVPVPIYPTKKRERTYNHAEVLASSLSKHFSIPMNTGNLKKLRWTQAQSELDKQRRLKNLKDSFLVVDRKAFSGKNVFLVDDVYTTGATLNECAKMLLGAGTRQVTSLTLARGL